MTMPNVKGFRGSPLYFCRTPAGCMLDEGNCLKLCFTLSLLL